MATQKVCDRCGRVIEPDGRKREGEEMFRVYTELGWSSIGDGQWREYHRRCARDLTIADVYNQKGFYPL